LLLLVLLLPPLAVYLVALGWINRRPRPVLMAGTWEFVGVLFALSGFLLFGGPAFLGSLDEQSRWFWLLGELESGKAAGGAGWAVWIAARLAYFLLVAGVAAFVLWRSRRLTSLYNVDARLTIPAVEQALSRLGLNALRAGDSFLIGGRTTDAPPASQAEKIQVFPERAAPVVQAPAATVVAPPTALHVDIFPLMRHATLRWEPAGGPVRREVEKELTRTLAEAQASEPESLLGGILSLLGVTLFLLALVSAGVLLLLQFFPLR
jgi:hypothetical protein